MCVQRPMKSSSVSAARGRASAILVSAAGSLLLLHFSRLPLLLSLFIPTLTNPAHSQQCCTGRCTELSHLTCLDTTKDCWFHFVQSFLVP